MPERRFQHVEDLRHAGLAAPDDTAMHFLWQIVDEGVLGASQHVSLGNQLLLHILDAVRDQREALLRARLAADFIARTRGRDTPVIGNSLALLLAGLDGVEEPQRSDELRRRIESWGMAAAARKQALVQGAVTQLAGTKGIMAFDYSSTVAAIVMALAKADPALIVVVPESRSIAGGARYLEEFLPAGISVRYLPDAAIEYGLGYCDTVLFGVETLRADGSFLNTIGSRMIARLGRENGTAIYGCTDLLKLDMQSFGEARPDPAVRDYDEVLLRGLAMPGLENADTRAPELEVIPAHLVTALLTEHGPTPPRNIRALGQATFGANARLQS